MTIDVAADIAMLMAELGLTGGVPVKPAAPESEPEPPPSAAAIMQRRPRGRPRKTSWLPCAFCGQPDGPTGSSKNVSPIRRNGNRLAPLYRIDGALCLTCWQLLDRRGKRHVERQRRYDIERKAEQPTKAREVRPARELRPVWDRPFPGKPVPVEVPSRTRAIAEAVMVYRASLEHDDAEEQTRALRAMCDLASEELNRRGA